MIVSGEPKNYMGKQTAFDLAPVLGEVRPCRKKDPAGWSSVFEHLAAPSIEVVAAERCSRAMSRKQRVRRPCRPPASAPRELAN